VVGDRWEKREVTQFTIPYHEARHRGTVLYSQRFVHKTTRLLSLRIAIFLFHQEFHAFDPITWKQTTAGLLSYWYTLTELNSKNALENARGLLLTNSGFLIQVSDVFLITLSQPQPPT